MQEFLQTTCCKATRRVKKIVTIAMEDDRHAPVDDSPDEFKKNYEEFVLRDAVILKPNEPLNGHSEVLYRPETKQIIETFLQETDRPPGNILSTGAGSARAQDPAGSFFPSGPYR
jgi:hypothetical protein